MKRFLTQGIFFLSLFGIVLVLLNVSVRKKGDYVLKLKPSQVVSVQITQKSHGIQLAQVPSPEGPIWTVTEDGKTAPADDRAVQTYLAFLARIAVVERFASADFADDVSRNHIGLGQLGVVDIALKSGKHLELSLGSLTPSGTELYAAVASNPDSVFTISNNNEKKLLPELMGLRSRQVFPLLQATAVTLTYLDESIPLRPQDAAATPVVQALRGLVYTNYFPEVAEDDLATYGLTVPDLTVAVTDSARTTERYDLSYYSGKYYLRRQGTGPQDVLILTDQSGRTLFKALQEFIVHRGAR